MKFLKTIFNNEGCIGLSSIRKKDCYLAVTMPKKTKYTFISPEINNNYLLK